MMSSDALITMARVTVEALFNGLWQGTLLCAVVGCGLACHRRANAATRYAIWCLTLVAVALLPLLRMVPVRRPAALSRMTIVSEPVQPVPIRVSQQEMAPRQMAQPKRAPVVAKSLPALRAELPASRPVATLRIRNRWPVIFFGAWLAGAALMLARLGWSFLHVRRLRRASVPLSAIYQNRLRQWLAAAGGLTRVELCGVEGITTPMSLGPIDPLIVMPTDFAGRLTESEFDQVLLHELAHVRRGDNWSKLVQRLIEALLFFHPAVWFTGRRLNLERESACDDWVVFMTGEVKPYAACLAKLAEATAPGRQPVLATGIFRGARQLTQRIERLLDRRRNTAGAASRASITRPGCSHRARRTGGAGSEPAVFALAAGGLRAASHDAGCK